ncbi:MAG: YceI family protein [Candidatus Cyclobacteriaceae bacterium M3_2C_046]
MKNLNLFFAAFFAIALFSCSGGGNQTENADESSDPMMTQTTEADQELETHQVDLNASVVEWEGTMLGVYSHNGTVELTEGTLETRGNDIVGGSFVVDLNSITPTDENYNPEEDKTKEKLVGHLQSDDFFLVSEYPNASFKITGSSQDNSQVMGELTIRGNTHEETIENVNFDPSTGTASGTLTFDRQKYDVSFQTGAQDMVLADEIELDIELKLAEDQAI